MPYTAPTNDIAFCLAHVVGFENVAATERFAEATPETMEAILEEGGKLATHQLAPLNRVSDLQGSHLDNGVVRTPEGFKEGYQALADGGWIGMAAPTEYGGMGLPLTLFSAMNEMVSGACLAMNVATLLSQGQVEALDAYASDEIKSTYLPKVATGQWSATMNLTEPQAGSDVGALRSTAEPQADGTYAISGQKIYISWGDHDITENVVHLVLARLPDAPQGTKGVSLFVVPKFLPDTDGNPGARNGVQVVSLEHKMGLHASPTCVMEFSEAKGWLVGAPGGGMAAMFRMMNSARLGVALQGVGVAEAATQAAEAYAQDRIQGKPLTNPGGPIADHADVRRMLCKMRADTFAARAIALDVAVSLDMGEATGSADWNARAAFLTPIAKAFGTDTGVWAASECIQVHGGMGFVEETGVAQYLRDVRITTIYEGTNGIQAMDLVGRKLMDGGEAAFRLLEEIESNAEAARTRLPSLAEPVWQAAETLREATEDLIAEADLNTRFAGAVPFLRAWARVLGGHYHLKAALADPARQAQATVFVTRCLPEYHGLLAEVAAGTQGLYEAEDTAIAPAA